MADSKREDTGQQNEDNQNNEHVELKKSASSETPSPFEEGLNKRTFSNVGS
jgi:hypothetical protein